MGECRQLVSLNLAANSLGDAGARAVAGCLPYCPWLTRLDLRSNNVGEQVRQAKGARQDLRLLSSS